MFRKPGFSGAKEYIYQKQVREAKKTGIFTPRLSNKHSQ